MNSHNKHADEVNTPGSRHLIQLIDHYADTTPDRTYASIPIDNADLSLGFRDISYAAFANAIDHCAHWLHHHLPKKAESLETVAYTGPKDIRYPILACALAKLEKKLLLPSVSTTPAAQAHLVRETGCTIFLHGGPFTGTVESVAREVQNPHVRFLQVPEVEDLIKEEKAREWRWEKSWEEARYLPWFIFHTSGTTGFPKPIVYTHQMMVSLDATELMPDAGNDSIMRHIPDRRWYSPLLTLHVVGMYIALQFTVVRGGIAVFSHPEDMSPAIIRDTLTYGKCQAIAFPPLYIEALAADPVGLEILRALDYVYFAGAALSRSTAEKLLPHKRPMPMMGTTEAGMYFIRPRDDEDWEYYTFREYNGIEFRHMDEDLQELVIVRKPELARWQQIFQIFPDLHEVRTGDLWVEHKSKPGAWKVVGRTDDLVVFSHGKKLNATQVEMQLSQCPGVAGVVVGGHNRQRPFVLVEWARDDIDDETKLGQLWPAIEKVNGSCVEVVRMQRELILFTVPERKLARNVKGGPVRKASEQMYAEEIERLYVV